ncbi:L-idonate 5-dehydrogenase [Thermus antranikianii]
MRAWVLRDYGSLDLEERPLPQGEGVLLKVVATGICGSDLSVYKGTPAMRNRWQPPLVLGHEVVGIVEEGPSHLQGRAVAVHPAAPCGSCGECQQGKPHLCPKRVHLGFHLPGGLAEWIRVPEGQLYPLPPGLPAWKGALAEPLAVALHGVKRAGPLPEGEVLVLGGGAMGSLVAWALKRQGAGVALVEPHKGRAELLMALGLADRVLSIWEADTNFPLVVDTVGSESTVSQALRASSPGGRVVVLGLGSLEAPLNLQSLVVGEHSLLGSYLFTPEEFSEAVDCLKLLPENLVRLWPAERAQEAFLALLEGRIPEPKVVLEWRK